MPAGSAYPSGHLVPSPFWDLLVLQLLRPNSSNLPCLYSTFHLEYPLVLSRFCFILRLKLFGSRSKSDGRVRVLPLRFHSSGILFFFFAVENKYSDFGSGGNKCTGRTRLGRKYSSVPTKIAAHLPLSGSKSRHLRFTDESEMPETCIWSI